MPLAPWINNGYVQLVGHAPSSFIGLGATLAERFAPPPSEKSNDRLPTAAAAAAGGQAG
eukprot:CAMPEP_0174746152 /NCGR_PEP_ID=MMETSP1094-20130205/88433_1 /TAXON_ID=156173 /ORGANISM="Chrysochromulina brevifilum, Strain UTEX LB 985" /LENGTH=58 /DNA_ID=CAMNT_0015950817 /DNA_START=64 /DNA_END=237 /DNA_ORIENTATION=+